MELHEAMDKANQILAEERSSPTVRYSLRSQEWKPEDAFGRAADALATISMLRIIRAERPRLIEENPKKWAFESVNYNLLCALLFQLPMDSRRGFVASLVTRLAISPGYGRAKANVQPGWVSEFPLVAEFCVRNGAKDVFILGLGEANPTPGLAILLRHLEDMIALNFNLFTEQDYEVLTTAITTLGHAARRELEAREREKGGLCREVIAATDAIKEECRKARYLYLKGALLEGLNLEVNQDKGAVESYLRSQGFSDTLIESLNHAERLYYGASTGFDFKSAMGHLRSFIERLHGEELAKLGASGANPIGTRWGDGLEQLYNQGLLTKAEKVFAAALFTLLSDEGVHPIIAKKEYVRLARNVVVEYALLFLRKTQSRSAGPRPL